MSERLIIRFEHNGRPVAAAFWRWGAYTRCAAAFADELIWSCENHVNITPRTGDDLACYRVIRVLRGLGGGFEDWDEERERAEMLERKFRKGNGNVYVFDSWAYSDMVCWTNQVTIDGFMDDADGIVRINLDKKTISFDSWQRWGREEYEKEMRSEKAMLLADFDPVAETTWEDFRERLLPILKDKNVLEKGYFRSNDRNRYYTAIE